MVLCWFPTTRTNSAVMPHTEQDFKQAVHSVAFMSGLKFNTKRN